MASHPGWRHRGGGSASPPAEAARIREIFKAYDEYHQVRLLDDPIRASYVGILILITLLIVFAASWMGIYLARHITVPVQLLAEGTEEVARGNLDVSLDYQSSDEFGTLVASFNRMTADLKAMKGNLEETNASLTRTYDELRRRTQFIETILHSISTGVIVIDRHGRIAMINKVAERLLRIPKDGAVGRMYREVLREEHYEAIRGLYREAGEAAGGQIERQVELVVGERRIALRVSLTALRDDAGEYMGLVAAFDDLSQAMRLQRVLAWREVARRIAHDIRNPLTPIQLSTERMQRKYAATHAEDPVFVECTQAILSGVNTLKRLVDEFTRFARMPVPHREEGDLQTEIRTVVDTYRTSHPGIRWEFRQEGPPRVWFDAVQIRRAVTNLLDNAAAALGERGNVAVSCTHDEAAGKARIDVADDGPGIPPGDRDRLFEPYFSRREGGTGLGLAIVSAIANDHGGTVRMRDNIPRGAVFEMEFPARPPAKGSHRVGGAGDRRRQARELIPDRFGKYRVLRRIASGGMAEVYLCRLSGEQGFRKRVALKVVHPRYADDPRFRELFAREARLAASLSHPNLIQVFDFGREGDAYFLAMEYVEGWNLAQAAEQARQLHLPISPGVWRRWVDGIGSGLAYLHEKGVVHRDVSPANVLVSRNGAVKITDFGVSLAARDGQADDGTRAGKSGYLAPERIGGEEATASSDLFAAGVISVELLLGRRLFEGDGPEGTLDAIRRFDARTLPLPGVSPALAGVLRKSVAALPADRYPGAAEFLVDLARVGPPPASAPVMADFWDALFPVRQEEETAPDPAAEPESRPEMVKEPEERYGGRGRTVQAGAAAVFAAVIVGGVLLWKEVRQRPAIDAAPASVAPAVPVAPVVPPHALRRRENRPAPNLLPGGHLDLPIRRRLQGTLWRATSGSRRIPRGRPCCWRAARPSGRRRCRWTWPLSPAGRSSFRRTGTSGSPSRRRRWRRVRHSASNCSR